MDYPELAMEPRVLIVQMSLYSLLVRLERVMGPMALAAPTHQRLAPNHCRLLAVVDCMGQAKWLLFAMHQLRPVQLLVLLEWGQLLELPELRVQRLVQRQVQPQVQPNLDV